MHIAEQSRPISAESCRKPLHSATTSILYSARAHLVRRCFAFGPFFLSVIQRNDAPRLPLAHIALHTRTHCKPVHSRHTILCACVSVCGPGCELSVCVYARAVRVPCACAGRADAAATFRARASAGGAGGARRAAPRLSGSVGIYYINSMNTISRTWALCSLIDSSGAADGRTYCRILL
eukprot:COSAG02_NODE_106_length_36326_cov_13.777266_8_plen_179_part_00